MKVLVRALAGALLIASAHAAAAAPDASGVVIEPAAGPYASIEALCAHLATGRCRASGGDEVPVPGGVRAVRAPRRPYRAIELVVTEALDLDCHVAMRLDDGWWLGRGFACGSSRGHSNIDATVRSLAITDLVPGGAPEVVARVRTTSTHDDDWDCADCRDAAVDTYAIDTMVVCGVGPAGPACTEAIPIASHHTRAPHRGGARRRDRIVLRARVDGDGLHLTGDRANVGLLLGYADAAERLAGTHPLAWP